MGESADIIGASIGYHLARRGADMRNGITLTPIIGRMAAEEILDGVTFDALMPYRPGRFSAAV